MAREPVTFAHPTGIRTWGKLGCKLPLWRFTFQIILNRRGTKLWKKMPSPSNKPASSALSGTVWFLERPNFIEGFAAIPPMEKAEDRKCWRRERNWGRTFSTQASVVQRTLAKRSVWRRQRNWAPTISRTISLELVPFRHIKSSGMWTARNFCLHSGTPLLVKKSGSNVGYSALGSARDVPREVWRYVRLQCCLDSTNPLRGRDGPYRPRHSDGGDPCDSAQAPL